MAEEKDDCSVDLDRIPSAGATKESILDVLDDRWASGRRRWTVVLKWAKHKACCGCLL